ncbi:L,D-transpeptidase [Rhodopseudomonas palustris]|uniref:ErfK/YbiS/YcfS/YnhG n=1 Tax=Rhodopseudomonas palustris (strain BisB18) TaxID=316056 RepID=Q20X92_RHOPB
MLKKATLALLTGASCLGAGLSPAAAIEIEMPGAPSVIYADEPPPPMRMASSQRPRMGGGFIEFLFSDGPAQPGYGEPAPRYQVPPDDYEPRQRMLLPAEPQQSLRPDEQAVDPQQQPFDPKYEKQLVAYHGKETPGTIVIDTPNKFLFLVQGDGTALRYGIGVGRPGFTWSGVKQISAKKEWPAWTPPPEMLARRPDLPRHMEGGPQNPLGARAMYLGSTLYRIHGSNEPWTIGTNVSSGCIRMRNEDVIDLYGRVNVGARVIVI